MKINTINKDNNKAYSYYAHEVDNPQSIVVLAHGLAEDATRYDYFAKKLNEENINVYCINHIAHGVDYTNLELGHWVNGDFDNCLSNINDLASYVKSNYPNIPIILMGHSMGSFMVQKFELLYPNKFNGHILMGCAKADALFKIGNVAANILYFFSKPNKRLKIMDTLAFGSFNKAFKPNKTEHDWLTKDVEICREYHDSRTCGFICTASFYKEFYKNVSQIPNKKYVNLYDKNYPILLVGGSDDMVSNRGKKLIDLTEFYKKQSNKVTQIIYENDRHEILNEFDKDKVIEDIVNWIKNIL